MQVHFVGGQKGGHHHFVVGSVLEFLIPALFLSFYRFIPTVLEMKFYGNIFPLVSALFGGVSKRTFKYNSFHLNITLQQGRSQGGLGFV